MYRMGSWMKLKQLHTIMRGSWVSGNEIGGKWKGLYILHFQKYVVVNIMGVRYQVNDPDMGDGLQR